MEEYFRKGKNTVFFLYIYLKLLINIICAKWHMDCCMILGEEEKQERIS